MEMLFPWDVTVAVSPVMFSCNFCPDQFVFWVSRRLEEEETRGGREERRREQMYFLVGRGSGLVGFLPGITCGGRAGVGVAARRGALGV
jgi:hypothetical protein